MSKERNPLVLHAKAAELKKLIGEARRSGQTTLIKRYERELVEIGSDLLACARFGRQKLLRVTMWKMVGSSGLWEERK